MPRSGGAFTAPSNSVNPAVEGTAVDETDFNALVDDIESALTESVYTAGLGSTDNQLVRTDGTDTKKVQGTGITVDDSNNVSGIAALSATTVNIGNADTTIARTGAGDISVEGNAIYRAGGTDVPITDGGTGASTATAAFNALAPTTTHGDIIYHNGTDNVRLGAGTAGQVLQSGGAGANPSWASLAGTGDVVGGSASTDGEVALYSGTGGKTLKRSNSLSGIAKLASGVLSAASAGTDYYAPGSTDVAIADGGTGASTAAAGARALLEGIGSTQGDILYRNGSEWTALGTGTAGQVLQAGGAGSNPSWATVAGTGDVTAASNFGTDNRLIRSDGTVKGAQASAVTVDDSGNMSGVGTLAVGGAVSGVTTLTQSSYTDWTEIAAPANPSANVARTYAFDVATVTRLAMRDSAGVVSLLDGNHNIQAFTSSGTFTTPAHSSTKTVYRYTIVGAGGGGGGSNGTYSSAGGGGSGGTIIGTFTGVAASTGITITIGAGGAGGASTGGNGSNGGSSSIGSPVSVTAGGGSGATGVAGGGAAAASAGGSGGTASGGTVNVAGGQGGNGASSGTTVFSSTAGAGASTGFGSGGYGGGGYVSGNGNAGGGYGSGGGGAMAATATGGAGAAGLVIIEWVL